MARSEISGLLLQDEQHVTGLDDGVAVRDDVLAAALYHHENGIVLFRIILDCASDPMAVLRHGVLYQIDVAAV